MLDLFEPTVREISTVMVSQLDRVLDEGIVANRLTVSGGSAHSPFLKSVLKNDLRDYNNANGTSTELKFPPFEGSGECVAIGNVLRGCDNTHSLPDILQFNVGISQDICVEETEEREQYCQEVLAQLASRQGLEGIRYIEYLIKWLMKKVTYSGLDSFIFISQDFQGRDITSVHSATYKSKFLLSIHKRQWIVEERIFLIRTDCEDLFSIDHEKKIGAQLAGISTSDLTPLKEVLERYIPKSARDSRARYEFELDMGLRVIRLNLELIARSHLNGMEQPRLIKGSRLYLSLVAALPPGNA
ncbi:hypothetical protein EJ02DRAFT_467933 [Clathrospora elynae]|uniref:Actin-like ATPase domain-containing protein n=1 Tax=Clathrospora elynae TaxID=706981 RepID=A0A6A5SJ50_9PLEO|nr:hypothetical protein EJ02DRAFT_467933 [Clathrospora elynae]